MRQLAVIAAVASYVPDVVFGGAVRATIGLLLEHIERFAERVAEKQLLSGTS